LWQNSKVAGAVGVRATRSTSGKVDNKGKGKKSAEFVYGSEESSEDDSHADVKERKKKKKGKKGESSEEEDEDGACDEGRGKRVPVGAD
jgi:hypothetical protein